MIIDIIIIIIIIIVVLFVRRDGRHPKLDTH